MDKDARIYVAGHNGMVGRAIVRKLKADGFQNFITRSSSELDLRDQIAVKAIFELEQPEFVFLAAARVGGIGANVKYPAEFIYENLVIQSNVIHYSHLNRVQKLLFVASSCIYPRMAPQPMAEDSLLSGLLEQTNEPYAIAKIAGIKMCEAYRQQYGSRFFSVLPCNLYGPGDNYHPENSHVLAALVRKCHIAREKEAQTVQIWGTGKPKREFLHVDDAAAACCWLMYQNDIVGWVNVGSGEDIAIAQLAKTIANQIGFKGKFVFDDSYPDGVPRKLLDSSKIRKMGWQPTIPLSEGIASTYRNFLADYISSHDYKG